MKKVFTVLIGFFLITGCFSQVEIKNVKSESHQLVPGTDVYLIPPANFLYLGMPGFVFPAADAGIFVTRIPESNINNLESEMDGMLEGNNLLSPPEDVIINSFQGKFFTTEEIREGDPITSHTMFFGNDSFVYLVMGVCPSDEPGIINSIKESMLTAVYDSNLKELNKKPFSIYVGNTKLEEAEERAGMMFYTVDGEIPTQSQDKTALIIGTSLYPVEVENTKSYTVTRIRQLPYEDTQVVEDQLREVQINGLSGLEFDFRGSKGLDRPEELVYVLMLYEGPKYYLLIGNAIDNFQTNLELFREVVSTFQINE